MSIRETTILKGVAILFMLYLHLFNQMANVNLCTTYLSIRGVPFVHLFSRCTGPVAFYLILSGYGLYISSKSGRKQNSLKRILKLYVHYWITLILFIPLGCRVIGSQVYPGSFSKFLENVTGWNTSYNGGNMVFVSVCFIDYFFTILVSYIEQDEAFICIYSYRYTLLIGLCIDSFIWSILFVFASVGLYAGVVYEFTFPFYVGSHVSKIRYY